MNPDALGNHVLAPRFREMQLAELRGCFATDLARVRPLHAWVHGPPGSGKTVCARHLLEHDVPAAGATPIYVNCRERFTFFAVIDAIASVVKPLRSPYRSRDHLIALLRTEFAERRAVLVRKRCSAHVAHAS